jgi:glycosyltransferase involved in cell wall biosynthesis
MTSPDSPPLVTTVIAVRNGERFLAGAIESVLAQTYRPLEILVVDGRSTDRTEAIARSYPEVRFHTQQGQGISEGYNSGVVLATGPLVAFLSHDDLWVPTKLERQVDVLRRRPEVDYVICHFRYFVERGASPPPSFRRELLERDLVGRIMETLLARRSVFEANGRFDPELALAGDVDWYARAKDRGLTMAIVPEVLLHKRVHESNASSDALVTNRELLRVLRDSIRRQRDQ